jgi:hypothetical protein
MTTNKPIDSYDEIKGMLNKVRKIQQLAKPNLYGLLKEQTYQGETTDEDPKDSRGPLTAPYGYGAGTKKPIPRSVGTNDSDPQKFQTGDSNMQVGQESAEKYFSDDNDSSSEGSGEDLAVINNVEIEIHSEDPEDLQLSDEEKNKVSQLIDDFRSEVSELVEFDKLDVYEDSAKLSGSITDISLGFTLSTGNDTGLYLSNASMLKIDDNSLGMINKLKGFEVKFANSINDLLVNRRTT